MSFLSAGYTFSQNEAPTPDTLHQLVEDANLGDLLTSELASGTHLCLTTTLGSPTTGDAFITDTGLLSWYDGSDYTTQMDGTAYTITLRSSDSGTLTRGMAVIIDPDTTTNPPQMRRSQSANANPRVVGVIHDASVANGALGQVIVRGYMEDFIVEATQSSKAAGSWLQGPTVNRSYAIASENPTTETTFGSAYFAIALEEIPDSSVASHVTIAAYIWR